MKLTAARATVALLGLVFILSGCEEMQGTKGPAEEASGTAALLGQSEARTEVRDVDRPDIFSVTDTGLWDGRPSLGGIWVAHPDVGEPERAKITNASNGKTIAGALFRRERANPGPRIQVSSDAAAALGMLAGQPTELTIVAVRQEEIELAPEPLPLAGEAPGAEASGEEAAGGETAAAAGTVAAAAAAEQPKRQGFWSRFRDSLRNKPASDVATEADTALIGATGDGAGVPDVETETLDPVTSAAAAAISEAEGQDAPRARPAAAASAPAAPAPAAAVSNPIIR